MSTVEVELRQQLKKQLTVCKDAGMAVRRIADDLEVEPATVYQLLQGETTPTAKVLCNACRNLGFFFQIDGRRIGASDFPEPPEKGEAREIQMGLFDLSTISTETDLTVRIGNRKSPGVTMRLDVRIAS